MDDYWLAAISAAHVSVVQNAADLGDAFLLTAGLDRNPVRLLLGHAVADFFANSGTELANETAQLFQ